MLRELVTCLQNRSIPIYLITGGFLSYVQKVAEALNIPKENIFANRLTFFHNGNTLNHKSMVDRWLKLFTETCFDRLLSQETIL